MSVRSLINAAMCCMLAMLGSSATTSPATAETLVLPVNGASNQVVLVAADSLKSTTARLATYERTASGWKQIGRSTSAFLGRHGLVPADQRRQSTGTTPMGTFALTTAFGRLTNPGSKLPYTQVDRNDAWTYNPKVPSTYNLFQDVKRSWRSYGSYVEHLWQLGPQYDYVVTTSFNESTGQITRSSSGVRRTDQPSNTKRGGGIFLHVSKGEPTVGCVSMPRADMRRIVQWLDPAAHPVVVIGLKTKLNP
ncbi:MAG: L,D-transpeptidase family protein [Actinomycetota bacterium]|nr:L,D-transpeptidase family protein [Actinomycetota bacterium]